MKNHHSYEELVAAEALGGLDKPDRSRLDEHIREGCPICPELRVRFKSVTTALDDLPADDLSAGIISEAKVKNRLLRRLQTYPQPTPAKVSRFFNPRLLAGSLAVAFILFLLYGPLTRKGNRPEAQLVFLQGHFNVGKKQIKVLDRIPYNQVFSTGDATLCDLRIAGAVVFRVGPNTEGRVLHRNRTIVVELQSGSVFSHVKPGTAYAVATSHVTVEALGTYFLVKTDSAQRTYVCICKGNIELRSTDSQIELASEHHRSVTVSGNRGKMRVLPDILRDHLDGSGMQDP